MNNKVKALEATEENVDLEKKEQIKTDLVKALEETHDIVMGGIFELAHPMLSRGQEVQELAYDFEQVTAKDMLKALDKHMGVNAFEYTEEQKVAVLALACRGLTENGGLDETDILEQIQGEDTVTAAFAGQRYLAYVNARMNRIVKEAEIGSSLLEGTMILDKPIIRKTDDDAEPVKALSYNFRRMKGMKYVECLAASNRTKAAISYGAGIRLFAEAVRSNQPIKNEELEKLPAKDAIVAALIGMGFFLQSRSGVSDRIRRRPRT